MTPLLLLACSGADALSPGPRPGPDVVLITVDTLRHDGIGHPAMTALADRGQVYTNATTPLVRTTPALASMLTGLTPEHHGSLEVGEPMTADSLVTRFQQAGWSTLGVSGSAVASGEQGLDAGFDQFELLDDPRASELTTRALELLPEDGSRFVWVHYTDTHFPYLPPNASEGPCRTLGNRARSGKLKRARIFANEGDMALNALDHCKELYAGEAAHADSAIATLLAAFDDPLVLLSSDHGENMGDWGLWFEHGPDVHPATFRIPLVLAGPGVPVGEDDGVAQLQDVMPTLLELAGLATPVVDGVSLLTGERPFAASGMSGTALHVRLTGYLRSGRADKRNCLNGPVYSLCSDGFFDHSVDPGLSKDLTGTLPEPEAALAAAAQLWPPERARQLTARGPEHTLVAQPTLSGYELRLFSNSDLDTPVEDDAALQALLPFLPAPPSGSPVPASNEAALRALGYIE